MIAVSLADDMRNIVERILSSYEARIDSLGTILDTTHQLLQDFQNSFVDRRQEWEMINSELRENLAKNESLRRRDFDTMMHSIHLAENERETEVRKLLTTYVREQKEMAHVLRDNLARFKEGLAKDEARRLTEFQGTIKGILARQDERRGEVVSTLKDFQKKQEELSKRLKALLAKGRELRIRHLKAMLKEFNDERREWRIRQEPAEEQLCGVLGDLSKPGLEAGRDWETVQAETDEGETRSCEAIRIDAGGKKQ